MAKASIVLNCESCGEKFTHTKMCYNRIDADDYEDWARRNICECPACYRARRAAEQAERVKAAVEGVDLPPLTGSEKQVKWASDLRNKFVSEAMRIYNDPSGIAEAVSLKTDSRWWIDHRYDQFSLICRLLAEEVNDDEK